MQSMCRCVSVCVSVRVLYVVVCESVVLIVTMIVNFVQACEYVCVCV